MFKDDQGDGLYGKSLKRFSSSVFITVFISFLTAAAVYLGGTSFVILGVGGIVASISLGLIAWTPYKAKTYAIPMIIGMIPLYMLFP